MGHAYACAVRSWMLVLFALLVPSSAFAQRTLLAYGDSLTGSAFTPFAQWPALLQEKRPDLFVVNAGKAGDTSGNVARFAEALALHAPDVVTIMLGTNDPVCAPDVDAGCDPVTATPARTARNIRTMALLARRRGADVYVLTQTPAVWKFEDFCNQHPTEGGCPDEPRIRMLLGTRQRFTRDVASLLVSWRRRPRLTVLHLRDEFTVLNWPALSTDGLHTSLAGNDVIASFLASRLPRY